MIDINNANQVREADKHRVYDSVIALRAQAEQAWGEMMAFSLPEDLKTVRHVVFAGMGGSNLGFRIVEAVFQQALKVPVTLVNHYHLPGFANEDTLVIASSYSGNTEETLMVTQQAVKRGCKVVGITTGGKLAQLGVKHEFPVYVYEPKHNPAGQPRLGLGYSVFAQLALFAKLGLMELHETEVQQVLDLFAKKEEEWKLEQNENNHAKQLAQSLHGFMPVWVGAEHLAGNARVANNQTNENAKSYSGFFALPELNHHLMEGLKHPDSCIKGLIAVAFISDLYMPRNKKRFEITKDVVVKNGAGWIPYHPVAETWLAQACEVLMLTNFVTFYLSMLYGEDPFPIPWVDFFKSELAKSQDE